MPSLSIYVPVSILAQGIDPRRNVFMRQQIANAFPDQDEIFLDADEPVQLLRVRWNTTFADEGWEDVTVGRYIDDYQDR
ncbi:MAG TPA: hypothetical protein VKI44_26295 [Acetobacteraceae bacterium]|nr:hypothetical protein [Acetobacteraceae bacterium]